MALRNSFRNNISVNRILLPSISSAVDDLDLSQMAKNALNYLRGNPDPARNYECKFSLGPLGIPYHLPEIAPPSKYGYDPVSLGDTDCRMDWQYSHMREMAGELEQDDIELGVRARIRGYQGDDHLVWVNPVAYVGEPIDGTWSTTWGSVKLMYSLAEEYERTQDKKLAEEANNIFKAVKELAEWDGDKAWYPGLLPKKDGEWLVKGWCTSFKGNYPFIVEPCVRLYECTGNEEALDFAKAVTEGFLAHSQPDMGKQRVDDSTGEFEGHIHAHTHAIWGVAHLGTILNEKRYLEWAKLAHDFVLSIGTDYGWYPEFYPQQEYRTEICVVGDMVSLGAWLARGVAPDYWDIVDRTVRNMLRRSQFMITPEFVSLFEKLHKNQSSAVVEKALYDLKKIEGGFVAQSSFDDWVSYITDEIGQAGLYRNGIHMMGCCPPEGMRGLWEAWNGCIEVKPEGVFINLCMSRDHDAAKVTAGSPETGMMNISAKRNAEYFIRTPAWAEHENIHLEVNNKDHVIEWGGPASAYIKLSMETGDDAKITWPVAQFTQTYNPTSIPEKEYNLLIEWTGNRVDSVSPKGAYLPMFQ